MNWTAAGQAALIATAIVGTAFGLFALMWGLAYFIQEKVSDGTAGLLIYLGSLGLLIVVSVSILVGVVA